MWDFIKIVHAPDIYIPSQPATSILSHKDIEPNFMSFMNEKFLNFSPPDLVPIKQRIQTLWTGALNFDGRKVTIKTPLKLIQCNTESNKFEVAFTSKVHSLDVEPNSILYYNGSEIVSKSLNAVIPSNSNTFIIGVILGKLYSAWPFLVIDNDSFTYSVKPLENSYIKINNMLIQWGKTSAKQGTLKLPIPFNKSYKVQGEDLSVSRIELESFSYVSDNKNTAWLAIGS
jgi:hypothetical protein